MNIKGAIKFIKWQIRYWDHCDAGKPYIESLNIALKILEKQIPKK